MHRIIITASLRGYPDVINLFGVIFFYFFCWMIILFLLLWLECYVKVEIGDHPEIQLSIANHLSSCASDISSLTYTMVLEKSPYEQIHFLPALLLIVVTFSGTMCGKGV
jgi:hypothetical protein